jgi:hypothetical protein
MYRGTYIQDCHSKSGFQQEAESLHEQIGLKFKEETIKKCQTWSTALYGTETFYTMESRSEIPGKFEM